MNNKRVTMIEVDNLARRYGDFQAVAGVSFNITAGEVVGLLGHNGAGKTTVMKMLTGYLEPSGGTARIDGLDVVADRQAVQSLIGYLPENCPLYPEMTVIDYLDYQAGLHGLADAERPAAIRQAIERTWLADKALDATRPGAQPQPGALDHAQSPQRAGVELREVVARDGLHTAAPAAGALARRLDDLEAEHVVADGPEAGIAGADSRARDDTT